MKLLADRKKGRKVTRGGGFISKKEIEKKDKEESPRRGENLGGQSQRKEGGVGEEVSWSRRYGSHGKSAFRYMVVRKKEHPLR